MRRSDSWPIFANPFVMRHEAIRLAVVVHASEPSGEDFRRLFDLSADLFCVVGFDGQFKRVNSAWERTLGYAQDDLLARTVLGITHPDDVEPARRVLAQLAEGKDITGFESRVVRTDGSLCRLEWNASSRPAESLVYAVGRDITQSHAAADQLRSMRRIATLIAEGIEPGDLFPVAAAEVARAVDVPLVLVARYEPDGTAVECASFTALGPTQPSAKWSPPADARVLRLVHETGEAARTDDDAEIDGGPVLRSAAASPIVAAGQVWGVIAGFSTDRLPEDIAARLAGFTELIDAAITNAHWREARERVAAEQAALRRVAMLVTRGVRPVEIFSAVSDEVGGLFRSGAAVLRFEDDGPAAVFVGITNFTGIRVGTRWEFQEGMASAEVYRTGRSARVDNRDWSSGDDPTAATARRINVVSTVASPIIVEGRLWGALTVSSSDKVMPADTEQRLEKFIELVATAIANAEAQEVLGRLADEQATLRQMATMVAQGVPLTEIFSALTAEAGRLFGSETTAVARFEDKPPAIVLVGAGHSIPGIPLGTRWELDDALASTAVYRTGRSARVDARVRAEARGPIRQTANRLGLTSTVASPIIVEGRLWGTMSVSTTTPLPAGTEERLERFSELLAAAIANAESRAALARLADEQAALRRVATLVASGVPPARIFSAVSAEVDSLFGLDQATVGQFLPDGPTFVVLGVAKNDERIPIGSRWEVSDLYVSMKVFRTGQSARVDEKDLANTGGPVAETLRSQGFISQVASPIIVGGRLWGAMTVTAREALPLDAEERLEKFTALVATAIANADGQAQLAASRRRIVAASDDARRRIERDLHDGTQQRLVSLALETRAAEASLPPGHDDLRAKLSGIATGLTDAVAELQELSRGIHPAILSRGGLGPALRTLARRSTIPVELDVSTATRLPEPIEVAAYYVASEAVANTIKHAQASRIEVSLATRNGSLLLSIRDDGLGGADPSRGSGLVGLVDRVEALGGALQVRSDAGAGTQITAELPLEREPADDAG